MITSKSIPFFSSLFFQDPCNSNARRSRAEFSPFSRFGRHRCTALQCVECSVATVATTTTTVVSSFSSLPVFGQCSVQFAGRHHQWRIESHFALFLFLSLFSLFPPSSLCVLCLLCMLPLFSNSHHRHHLLLHRAFICVVFFCLLFKCVVSPLPPFVVVVVLFKICYQHPTVERKWGHLLSGLLTGQVVRGSTA